MSNEIATATPVAGTGTSANPVTKTVTPDLTGDPSAARRIMEDLVRTSLKATEPAKEAAAVEEPPKETPQLETPEATPAEAEPTPEPGEAPAEGEADHPAEGEEPEPADDKREKQWPESARKRVDKLTAKRRELEAQLEEAKSKVKELESQPKPEPAAPPAPEQPPAALEEIQTVDALDRYERSAEALAQDLEMYHEGLLEDGERVKFEKFLSDRGLFDPETGETKTRELAQLRFDVRRTLKAVPFRRAVIVETARIDPHITKLYPYWADPTHKDYARAQEVLRMMPLIKSRPNWKHLVSLFLRGVDDEARILTEIGKSKVPGNGAPKPPPKVPGTPAAAVAATSGGAISKEDRDRAFSGSREDRVEWVRRQLPKLVTTG